MVSWSLLHLTNGGKVWVWDPWASPRTLVPNSQLFWMCCAATASNNLSSSLAISHHKMLPSVRDLGTWVNGNNVSLCLSFVSVTLRVSKEMESFSSDQLLFILWLSATVSLCGHTHLSLPARAVPYLRSTSSMITLWSTGRLLKIMVSGLTSDYLGGKQLHFDNGPIPIKCKKQWFTRSTVP